MEDRLEHIRRKISARKVYWSAYNPRASYLYDVEDADDDIQWLLREVSRLREALARADRPGGTDEGRPPR